MELLKQLYKIYSPSNGEKKMRKFLNKWINRNIDNVNTFVDSSGNLLVVKGCAEDYPCIVAHMDQVQKNHSKDFTTIDSRDCIMGFSMKNHRQEGLGADDKNGIWIALKCLQRFDNVKCAFFVGEEIGCVGSQAVDMKFFEDCRFVLQCDRRGNNDLITNIWSCMCSDEFLNDINYEKYGYKQSNGLMTDVATLRERGLDVCALNMSCGYYEPHTDIEFTIKSELLNCLDFVCNIIENCKKRYEYKECEYLYSKYYESTAYFDEYEEMEYIIEEYMRYDPYTTPDMFYDTYKESFPSLTKQDYYDIFDSVSCYSDSYYDDTYVEMY